jgi:exosortase
LAWLALCNKLRVDWTANDQYQYGWFVPPLALALLALRWTDRPPAAPELRPSGWVLALLTCGCLFLLGPVRLTEEPNPDWRLLFWLHAGLLVTLSLALLAWTGGWPWVRHFAFPLGFLLLAVPWPSEPEQAIVQSLMRVVAAISAEGMNLLGIPAQAQGNLIHLRDQTVGVDEACSGIRSLQTMLMGGLLLGELSRLRWTRRWALLAGGLLVAMAANVFRCSLLVWIAASYGMAAFDRFHDLAGVSVLLIVFAGLLWMNNRLARGNRPPGSSAPPAIPEDRRRSAVPAKLVPPGVLVMAAVWLLAIEAGTVAWYGLGAPAREVLPAWTVVPPSDVPGFQNVKIDDRSRRLLRFDHGLSANWTPPGAPGDHCTLFFFRWEPGHASAAQAEMHQPHICLTASGLTQIADWGIQPLRLPNGITLPVRRYEFELNGRTIYVFFVVWQDRAGAQPLPDTPGSRWDRFQAVLERRPNLGRQTLEFIVAGPTSPAQAAAQFADEAARMVRPVAELRQGPNYYAGH